MLVDRTDPYAVLGLTPQATQEQIRRAYRALMRENHPDTRPSGEPADSAASNTTLLQVIAAYALLGDPESRAGYDHRNSPPEATTRTRVRPAMRRVVDDSDQSPIQAGPVRWHGSRR